MTQRAAASILTGDFSAKLKQTLLQAVEADSFNFNSWSLFHTLTQMAKEEPKIRYEMTEQGQWSCQLSWHRQVVTCADQSKNQARKVAVLQRMKQIAAA